MSKITIARGDGGSDMRTSVCPRGLCSGLCNVDNPLEGQSVVLCDLHTVAT